MIDKLKNRSRQLADKHRHITSQFVKYLAVAFIGLIVDFGTLVLLREVAGVHYLIAAAGGFLAGLAINYLLSNRYVFGDPKIKSHAMNFGLFGLIGLVGLGILSLLMWAFTDGLNINYIVSKVLATIFVYMWNFFARRSLYHNESPAGI